jgi:hypothetical protein
MESQGILARLRWQAGAMAKGKGGDVRVSPVSFPICHQFRRLMISAECEPDKSNGHQNGAGYDQPMWISHLSIPSSRSFSLLEYLRTTFRAAPAAPGRGDYDINF